MTLMKLDDMIRGWVVGDFEPTCYRTKDCEVACQRYAAGDREPRHVHRVATEITLIASGRATMNGRLLGPGDIVVLNPGDATDFVALEATTAMVVKLPSVPGDKYLVDDPAGATPAVM